MQYYFNTAIANLPENIRFFCLQSSYVCWYQCTRSTMILSSAIRSSLAQGAWKDNELTKQVFIIASCYRSTTDDVWGSFGFSSCQFVLCDLGHNLPNPGNATIIVSPAWGGCSGKGWRLEQNPLPVKIFDLIPDPGENVCDQIPSPCPNNPLTRRTLVGA